MSILKSVTLFSVISLILACAASAQTIDDDTKCSVINAMLEPPSPDKQRFKEAIDYIAQSMRALDRMHGLKGKIEILPQMTEEGRSAVALIVTDRCHSHASLTVADTAVETYEAIRVMQTSLGLGKPQRKLAVGRRPRTYSVSALAPRSAPRSLIRRAQAELVARAD